MFLGGNISHFSIFLLPDFATRIFFSSKESTVLKTPCTIKYEMPSVCVDVFYKTCFDTEKKRNWGYKLASEQVMSG